MFRLSPFLLFFGAASFDPAYGQSPSCPNPTTSSTTIAFEAECYLLMQGVRIEDTSDGGVGKNVAYIDAGDWMTYPEVTIPSTGAYRVEYRVASGSGGGSLQLEKAGGTQVYGTVSIQNTGGWQNWQTVSHTVNLNAGPIAFGIYAISGGWNINWFRITLTSLPAATEYVFAYGDSLTYGHSEDLSRPTPYARFLNQALTNQLQSAPVVQHLGLPGWTASQMLDKINDETNGLCPIIRRNPALSLITIMVGTNDIFQIGTVDRAKALVQTIVDLHTRALSCARGVNNVALQTLSIGIPGSRYQYQTPIAGQMASYINNALKEFASSDPRISYVDFPTPFRENDSKWLTDGLHMSGEGYKFLGEALSRPVTEILASSRTGASMETWSGLSGNSIADLMRGTNNLANAPSKSERLVDMLEAPTDTDDNYGRRIKGWLVPPVTGLYEFWIASDDQGEFWLSSSGDSANKVRRCSQPDWVSPRFWDKYPEQKSLPIALVAGQAYYYEALMKEGLSGDHLAIAWQYPGQQRVVIPAMFSRLRLTMVEVQQTPMPTSGPTSKPMSLPTTGQPTSRNPTTRKPTATRKPTTRRPTHMPTQEPTHEPTTDSPTTGSPSTESPTTDPPTTNTPTTIEPTTNMPTTAKPTSRKPTSRKPSTRKPSTRKPTTSKPILQL